MRPDPHPRHDTDAPPGAGPSPDREARHGGEGWWRRRDRHGAGRWGGRRSGAGFLGCLLLTLVLFAGAVTALATWIAGAVLGLIAPGARPSSLTTVAVIVVIAVAVLVGGRIFGSAVRPLAELASATERLADGEPGVRVEPRGPRPVRSLVSSFNTMAGRLDRSRSDRQALLADVTHELRTPLTVISGGVEAMLDGVHPRDDEHLGPILAEVQVMDRLLDDLRTMSLAEAGALPLHREPVDLAALAADVVAAHAARAAAADVHLLAMPAAALVTSVDPVRVREVLANLVTNALRHTPAGGRVEVAVSRHDGDALLSVHDTGEGIAPDDLPRVFDRFHRRADSGGSGLGLTIARDLVAAHGGTIDVASDGVPGRGSTFRVRLPLRA